MVWSERMKIIVLSLAIGFMAVLYKKYTEKPTYTASYRLFLKEESGGLSSALRLASSFGLGAGGGSASTSATVQEYLTSRSNIAYAMTLEHQNGRLIDRYYKKKIENNDAFAKEYTSKFGVNQRYTDSVLIQVALGLNSNVLNASFDENHGLIEFKVVTDNERFTYDLATLLVTHTENQFKAWKKETGLAAVAAFQKKVDSLELSMNSTLREIGEYQDQNNSLISAVHRMEMMRLTIDMEALKVAYGEYIKGLEMSKAELMNMEGPFKYFDEPIYPLEKTEVSLVKIGILWSLITGVLFVCFIVVRSEINNIMSD